MFLSYSLLSCIYIHSLHSSYQTPILFTHSSFRPKPMRLLLDAQVVPFEPANPARPRANPYAGLPSFFAPHVLNPEGRVLDEKALEPVVLGHSVIRPQPELNPLNPSPLKRQGPVRDSSQFVRHKLDKLATGPRNGHFIPAVVRHSGEEPPPPFMPFKN